MANLSHTSGRKRFFAGLIVIVLSILVAAFIFRHPLWRSFIWPYYVAPIVADAGGESGGITSHYNPYDTTTYAILLVVSVLIIYRLFKRYGVRLDGDLTLALVPLIMAGGILRALEDAELYSEPVQYLFIAPIIYVVIGVPTVALVLFATHLARMKRPWPWLVGTAIGFSLITTLIAWSLRAHIHDSMPIFTYTTITILNLAGLWLYHRIKNIREIKPHITVLCFTLPVFITALITALWFHNDRGWMAHYIFIWGSEPASNPGAVWYIPAFLLTALALYGIIFAALTKIENLRALSVFLSKENVALATAQYLDATATFVGLTFFNYSEKHVLPTLFIHLTGTPAVMYALKTIVVIAIVWALDIRFAQEFKESGEMKWLIRFAVITLGLAPGTRDAVRIIMGV